jgi:hypothetical protein
MAYIEVTCIYSISLRDIWVWKQRNIVKPFLIMAYFKDMEKVYCTANRQHGSGS